MKREVKKMLKERGKLHLFTEGRYRFVKFLMNYGMTKDAWLKNYLSLEPLNKAQWCADRLIFLEERQKI